MKKSEVGQLVTAIASTDNRTLGMLDIDLWAAILPDEMSLSDAMAAVIHHRQTSDEWLMPKHVIDAVGAERRERLRRAGDPPMPGDLTYAQEKSWRQLWCSAVKDGETRDQAARIASEAMQIPIEIEPPRDPAKDGIIARFATRDIPRAAPKPKPKPKKFRWGPWTMGYHDDDDNPIYGFEGAVALFHDGGPYGIQLSELRTKESLDFWVNHIGGKGWGTPHVLECLKAAFRDLNPNVDAEATS